MLPMPKGIVKNGSTFHKAHPHPCVKAMAAVSRNIIIAHLTSQLSTELEKLRQAAIKRDSEQMEQIILNRVFGAACLPFKFFQDSCPKFRLIL
jgi:hypothetical protein